MIRHCKFGVSIETDRDMISLVMSDKCKIIDSVTVLDWYTTVVSYCMLTTVDSYQTVIRGRQF